MKALVDNLVLKPIWIVILITIAYASHAQAPLGVNYQGVARNTDGSPKSEMAISVRVSILNGGITGVIEYSEIHHIVTNQFGLFSLVIGQGDNTGSIEDVSWAEGNKWLQIEMDTNGGTNFEVIGAQQIFSVPYAMYATESGSGMEAGSGISVEEGIISNTQPDQPVNLLGAGNIIVSGNYPDYIITGTDNVNDADNDPSNELQTLEQSGSDVILSDNGGTISIDDADSDPANEIQDLNLINSGEDRTISISGGNEVNFNIADQDNDSSNEIQDAGQVSFTPAGNLVSSDVQGALTELQEEIDLDSDKDAGNEIQDLNSIPSGTDRTINITGGTGTTFSIADNDNDQTNEIQNASEVGVEPGGNLTSTDVQGALMELQDEIDLDGDQDADNELQSLSAFPSGTDRTINITGGTGATFSVADSDNDSFNEIQNAGQVGVEPEGNLVSTDVQGALTELQDEIDLDGDQDAGNELQSLSAVPSGTDRTINITGGTGATFSVADSDNDPVNEIQSLSSTSAGTDRTINISGSTGTTIDVADLDNNSSNELQTLNQAGNSVTLSNGGGSISVDDGDSDASNEIQDLQSVISEDNDAGGQIITNLADPVVPSDAVTKGYLDLKVSTDFAFKVPLNITSVSGGDFTFNLTTYDFDDGSLISGTQIEIDENGVYSFTVKGTSSLVSAADIYISINTTDIPVFRITAQGYYQESFLLKLNQFDIIELKVVGSTAGEVFDLEFFGFKI